MLRGKGMGEALFSPVRAAHRRLIDAEVRESPTTSRFTPSLNSCKLFHSVDKDKEGGAIAWFVDENQQSTR